MQTRFAGLSSAMRTYKRKSNRGLTSLDNMNAAVKEVLDEGRKCHAVPQQETSTKLRCDDIALKCAQAEQLKRSDTRKTDACSAQQRRQVLLSMRRRQHACSTVSVRRKRES